MIKLTQMAQFMHDNIVSQFGWFFYHETGVVDNIGICHDIDINDPESLDVILKFAREIDAANKEVMNVS